CHRCRSAGTPATRSGQTLAQPVICWTKVKGSSSEDSMSFAILGMILWTMGVYFFILFIVFPHSIVPLGERSHETPRFYADRAAGGDRHHRHPHRPAAARRSEGARGRRTPQLPEQPPPARRRGPQLPQRQQPP